MTNWRDRRQVQAVLTPIDIRPPDHNLYCYHPSGELYVVVPPRKWKSLREQGHLNSYLDKQRKSGDVVASD